MKTFKVFISLCSFVFLFVEQFNNSRGKCREVVSHINCQLRAREQCRDEITERKHVNMERNGENRKLVNAVHEAE